MPLETKTEHGDSKQMPYVLDDMHMAEGQQIKRVDLACGQQKEKGWIGIDRQEIDGVDTVHDLLTFPWPFEDNSIYEMRCAHFVEHIPHQLFSDGVWNGKDGLVQFMEEVYRCLQPLGTITIIVPYYTSVRAWQDPTHCRAMTDITFNYFCKKQAQGALVDHYTGKCDFEMLSKQLSVNSEFQPKSEEAKRWAMRHYWNVVDDMQVVLRALK